MPLQNVLLTLLCPAPACLSVDCTKQRSFVWSSSTAAGGCWMNETSTPLLMEPITWYELFVVVWRLFGTRPRVRAAAQHTWRNCSPRVFCEWKNNIDRFGPLPPAQHSSRTLFAGKINPPKLIWHNLQTMRPTHARPRRVLLLLVVDVEGDGNLFVKYCWL